jgi:hypothetical protein
MPNPIFQPGGLHDPPCVENKHLEQPEQKWLQPHLTPFVRDDSPHAVLAEVNADVIINFDFPSAGVGSINLVPGVA